MSKIGCKCGHVIRDQTDSLPYKARILRDYDDEAFCAAIGRECEALVAAILAGDREAWLRRHYAECYPRDLSHEAVFLDFVSGLCRNFLDDVYECEACGRLWVQRPGTDNDFVPFVSEEGKVERVLRSPRDQRPA